MSGRARVPMLGNGWTWEAAGVWSKCVWPRVALLDDGRSGLGAGGAGLSCGRSF